MTTNKLNNNEVLEKLKEDLKDTIKKIPPSENKLAIDFMKNVWVKLFVASNKKKTLDIHFVISYIDNRMKNTKNRQHQAFWTNIYKMLLKAKDDLEKIDQI